MGARGVPTTGIVKTTKVGYGYDRAGVSGDAATEGVGQPSMPSNYGEPAFYQSLVDHGLRERKATIRQGEEYCREYRQESYEDYNTLSFEDIETDIRPARVHSLVHTNEAATFNRDPKIFLRGFTERARTQEVPLMERMLNAEWEDDPTITQEVGLCGRDCSKHGYGVAMTFYKPHPDEIIEEETDEPAELADPFSQLADADAEAAEATYQAGEPAPVEMQDWEMDDRVVYGRISTLRLSPKQYVRDPDTARFEEAMWHCRIISKPLYVVHKDESLGPRRMEIGSSAGHSEEGRRTDRRKDDTGTSPFDYVRIYEVWERREEGKWWVVMFADGHDFFLRNEESPYWMGHPFEMLSWNEDGEVTYPVADAHLTRGERKAEKVYLNRVADGLGREHIDTHVYDKASGLSQEDLREVLSSEGANWIGIDVPSGRRINDAVTLLQKTSKTPELMNFISVLDEIMKMATGYGNNQLGQPMRSGTSASEAMEVAGFARARGSHKSKAVEEFVGRIAQKRMSLMVQYYKADRVHRLLGEEPAKTWAALRKGWTKGDIQQGLRVRVEPGSMKPENDETRVQKLTTVLQLVAQQPILMGQVDMPKLFGEIMKEIGFEDGASFLLDPDPNLQRKVADMILQSQGGGGGGGSSPSVRSSPGSNGAANQQTLGASRGGAS